MPDHHIVIAALQAEIEQLRQREAMYHSLYRTMTEGVALHEIITDVSGIPIDYRILEVNPAYELTTGLPRTRVVGQLASVIYGGGEPPYLEIYAQVATTGFSHTFETFFTPMQRMFRIVAFAPVPGQFATVFFDITAQRQAELTLRESEARYRAISELMSDFAFALRVEADGSMVPEWVTGAFTRIMGLTPADAADPERMQRLIYPDDVARVQAHQAWMLAGEHTSMLEFRIVRGNEVRWLRDHTRSVWDAAQQRVVRIFGAVKDITAQKQAEETFTLFKTLVEHATDGIVLLNLDSTIYYANPAATRMLGLPRGGVLGASSLHLIVPEERHLFRDTIVPALMEHEQWQGETSIQRPDGTRWRAQSSIVALRDGHGNMRFAASIFRDVTEQRRLEEQLMLTRFALDHARDGVAFLDQAGQHLYVNYAICRALGYTREELLALRVTHIDPQLSPEIWQEIWDGIKQQGSGIFEGVHYRKDGSHYPVEIASTYIEFEGIAYLCSFARDITERKAYQQQIERLAFTDSLTGLANRRSLYQAGEAALRAASQRPESVALLYLDLDRFKAFNDTLGHDTGDELLIHVTNRLQQSIYGMGVLARIGGDEFAIVLTNTTATEAAALAQHLLEQLRQPFDLREHRVYLSGSIGVALGTAAGQPFSLLMTQADIAMYRAKRTSTGVQVYNPASSAVATNQVQVEAELRQSLRAGALTLHYQPILDLSTEQLFAVEALVRWPHPTRGLLLPGSFLPLAEEAGFLKELDAWVLQTALTQAATWLVAGHPLTVTVNLSAPSFQQIDLVEQIATLLATTGVPAERLIVEVAEQTALHDLPFIHQVLTRVQALGVRIALDDFGTGYASLSHLRELPVNLLKVERAFAAGIGHNRKDEALLRAMLALGAGLELDVVAEGVEQEAQRAWLRAASCRHIQGFLTGRPVPPEQLNGL